MAPLASALSLVKTNPWNITFLPPLPEGTKERSIIYVTIKMFGTVIFSSEGYNQ